MDAVVIEVLNRSAVPAVSDRVLCRADLLRPLASRTRFSVPRGAIDGLLDMNALSGERLALVRTAALSPATAPPIEELADRREPLDTIDVRLDLDGRAWLAGISGHGKSSAAIRTTRTRSGSWGVLRLRGHEPAELRGLFRRATAEAPLPQLDGVALDDFDALTFTSAADDSSRFRSSKQVGAHSGLTPKKRQSGETDIIGGVTKAGDAMTHSMLHEARQA